MEEEEQQHKVAGQERPTLPRCITWAACFLAICVSTRLLQEPTLGPTRDSLRDVSRRALSLGAPPALASYAEFRRGLMRDKQRPMTALEHSLRSLLFNANLGEIGQHNLATLMGIETYYIEQSPFRSDLTWGEQEKLEPSPISGNHRPEGILDAPVSNCLTNLFGPREPRKRPDYPLDSDLTTCLGPIRNQDGCGACYAFSLMALLEWHRCMQSEDKQPVDFSEQFLIDCGSKGGLLGCEEGRLTLAKDFILFFGLKWEQDHPYRAKSKKSLCTDSLLEENKVQINIRNWRRIPIEREVFERTLDEQPILLEANLPANIRSYSRGIHPAENCDERKRHGILLVGYGEQDGHPFWLLRNSYGDRWGGEGGYIRMSRKMSNMAGCFPSAFVAEFRFMDLPDGAFDEFYAQFKYQPPKEFREVSNSGLTRSLLVGS